MGEELDDDCEFWLPPSFLTDDDFLSGEDDNEAEKKKVYSTGFGELGSGLSSPGESVVCSTETESGDEDDYLTGLTRKMAQSTLDDENCYGFEAGKKWGVSGSPKSPLCKYGSSRSSFRTGPTGELNRRDGAWDLLCAAAGEVSRMKMAEVSRIGPGFGPVVAPPSKPGPKHVPLVNNTGPNFGFSSNQAQLSYQQLQAAWFERFKLQQLMRHQQQMNDGCFDVVESSGGFLTSAWPTLQQSHQQQQRRCQQPLPPPPPAQMQRGGSGMRAVFLGNPGVKRECAGTGVFIPRGIGSHTETLKNKAACSTVLLPERVVHALNLNLEPVDAQPQPRLHSRYNRSFAPEFDEVAAMKYRVQQQKQSSMGTRPPHPMMMINREVRLPQDWTY